LVEVYTLGNTQTQGGGSGFETGKFSEIDTRELPVRRRFLRKSEKTTRVIGWGRGKEEGLKEEIQLNTHRGASFHQIGILWGEVYPRERKLRH